MNQLAERHKEKLRHKKRVIQSYRAKADARRTPADKVADFLTVRLGSVVFLFLNVVWFLVWITINTGLVSGIKPFDPFPFGLLTMTVSLEAIFLAIIVLISQNRAAKVAEIREEIDLQITTISESEVTQAIYMLTILLNKNGIDIENDPKLADMLKPLKSEELEKTIEEQIS